MLVAPSWSYSSYSSAMKCLRYYKYCYVDKLVPEGPESGDLVFGSALHSALNTMLTGGDFQTVFQAHWDIYKDRGLEFSRPTYYAKGLPPVPAWEHLGNIGAGFLRKFKESYGDRMSLKFAEQRLYAEYKGVKFEGTPDFYGTFDGVTTLGDFKTASQNYSSDKADMAKQLYLYAFLTLENKIGGIDNLAYFVFNKGTGSVQTPLVWPFQKVKMVEALDNIVANVTRLPAVGQDFYPMNWNACHDYNRRCQYWNKCHLTTVLGGAND